MDKNKSAEEIQTHIVAGYNGEWVKFEDHQKAIATLQQANAELQESISIVRAEYQRSETLFTLRIEELEKKNAELVECLKDAKDVLSEMYITDIPLLVKIQDRVKVYETLIQSHENKG